MLLFKVFYILYKIPKSNQNFYKTRYLIHQHPVNNQRDQTHDHNNQNYLLII